MTNRKQKLRKQRMARNRKSFIFIIIICMGIGFAFLSSTLTITGNTSVSGNSWKVYFNSLAVTNGSVDASVTPEVSGTTTTSLDYTILLDKPGDFYEFTVEAKNDGTIDASIESITEPNIASRVLQYLNYSVTYADGTPVREGDILKKKTSTNYKVRIEYRTDIEASDLDAEGVNLDLSFGVRYEQYTPVPSDFVKLVKSNALSDTGLNFKQVSSSSNGQGLYLMESTKRDDYPIYYYRGNVTNNNAKFAGFCWKIVRTTETGGTKLIYNGLPREEYINVTKIDYNSYSNVNNDEEYAFTYDTTTDEWVSTNHDTSTTSTLSFTISTPGDYYIGYEVSSEARFDKAYFYKDEELLDTFSGEANGVINISTTASTVIKVVYEKDTSNSDGKDTVRFSILSDLGELVEACNPNGKASQMNSVPQFNPNYNSMAYNGYMYGTVYEQKTDKTISSSYTYGTDFDFVDVDENISGDGTYTLQNQVTDTSLINTHHYTCFNDSGTCSELYYIYFINGTTAYYISLKDGKSVEDAINEMQMNITDSNAKIVVDDWFNNTFNTYFVDNNKNYNDYLEDTIWCNDRSINTISIPGLNWLSNSGWIPNGGDTSNGLAYTSAARVKKGTPSLACPNKNDSFTVTESATGNGALTYPVGLLTADEVLLAGGQESGDAFSYLANDNNWWTMTPSYFNLSGTREFNTNYRGSLYNVEVVTNFNVRPSISLKASVKIRDGGEGTFTNPYEFIVE